MIPSFSITSASCPQGYDISNPLLNIKKHHVGIIVQIYWWSATPSSLSQRLCYHCTGYAFSVSFSIAFGSACFLNAGISQSPLLSTLLLQRAKSPGDLINTSSLKYLLCARGSQAVSLLHLQTSSCLWESTVWKSPGHFKLMRPIMNSSSFLQPSGLLLLNVQSQ